MSVTVVVPVLRRPQNAAPFMNSLNGACPVLAVANPEDHETQDAWVAAGAKIGICFAAPGTFAQKANDGFRRTTTEWMFLTGDDVKFHPGWLRQALQAADKTGAKVVGTNDLGMALAIDHSPHWLINRDYALRQGASWDGPGIVCHEGYHHWFIDNELVTVAKQRDVWTLAKPSIVEHLHPKWGKADADEVYNLGQLEATADQTLFESRHRRLSCLA